VALVLPELYSVPNWRADSILQEVNPFALIYPMLALARRDEGLTSRLSSCLGHRSLKTDRAGSLELPRRILFVAMQALFYNVQNLKARAAEGVSTREEVTGDLLELLNQARQVITVSPAVIHLSLFLGLRMMYLMKDLYETACLLHGEVCHLPDYIQPLASLKTQWRKINTMILAIIKSSNRNQSRVGAAVTGQQTEDAVSGDNQSRAEGPREEVGRPRSSSILNPAPSSNTRRATSSRSAFVDSFQQLTTDDEDMHD